MSLLRQIYRAQVICPSIRSCSSSSPAIGSKPFRPQGTLSSSTSSNSSKRYRSSLYQTPTIQADSSISYRNLEFSGTSDRGTNRGDTTAREEHQKHENTSNHGQKGESSQDNHRSDEEASAAAEDEQRFKDDLLELALNHVKTVGWSTEAIARAAAEAGLSPAVGSMFKDVDLVHYFISKNNEGLEKHLAESRKNEAGSAPNLRQALEWRLQKVVPFASSYSEAIAIISRPEHVTKSVGFLMDIADTIAHHSLKDSSTDLNWYSKRIGIAGIFVATELCLIQDKSEGYVETWTFLERRCQEFDKYGKGEINLTSVPGLPDLLHVGFTTVMNIIGRNAPR